MPDTYISQFSGEEIDAALRAAQIISGASTPAELRKKLEIRGDTIPVSAEDSTLISDAVKYRTNPNLLDNWYFGRPVNQRDGYIPKDIFVKVYNDVTCTDYAGPVNYYPSLIKESNGNFKYNIGSKFFYIKAEDAVSGYANVGYTVDRWKAQALQGTVTCENDCLAIENTNGTAASIIIDEIFEPDLSNALKGKTLTLSVMVKSVTGKFTFQSGDKYLDITEPGLSYLVLPDWVDKYNYGVRFFNSGGAGKIDIYAAKLELGGTQTLAHKENGVWVLNEIPDFGEQLRRCQRHAFSPLYEAYATAVICNLFISRAADGVAFGEVTLPVSMRNKPVFSGNASKFWIVAENGGGASHPTAIAVMGLSADKVMIQVNGSYTANTQYILYVENPFTSADFLLSADL